MARNWWDQYDEPDDEGGPSQEPAPEPEPEPEPPGPYSPPRPTDPRLDPRNIDPRTGLMVEPGRTYRDMPGFVTGRIADPNEGDPKYVMARIIQNMGLQPTAEGMQTLFTELQKVFPGVRLTGDEVLDFSGVAGIERFGAPIPQDAIRDFGGPNAQWQFLNVGGPGGGADGTPGPGGPGGGGPHGDQYDGGFGGPYHPTLGGAAEWGELVAPWEREFSYPGYEPTPAFTETFAPETYTPPEWQDRFRAPTLEEMYQDPGIQFELAEGQKGIERSAAAQGTLLTGGTLTDLQKFRQGLASTRYGDVYGRRFGEYGQRFGEFGEAAGRGERAFERNQAGRLLGYQSRRDVAADLERRGRSAWQTGYEKSRSEFDLARDVYEANQAKKFNRLMGVAQLGRF